MVLLDMVHVKHRIFHYICKGCLVIKTTFFLGPFHENYLITRYLKNIHEPNLDSPYYS